VANQTRAQRLERANEFQENAERFAPNSPTRTNYLLSALVELTLAQLETADKPAPRTRKAPEAVTDAPAE
jgi:hypothetical protein